MADIKKEFPIELLKTKVEGLDKTFDLSDPEQRKEYFKAKAGPEIEALKKYFKNNTFIAYWLGNPWKVLKRLENLIEDQHRIPNM